MKSTAMKIMSHVLMHSNVRKHTMYEKEMGSVSDLLNEMAKDGNLQQHG